MLASPVLVLAAAVFAAEVFAEVPVEVALMPLAAVPVPVPLPVLVAVLALVLVPLPAGLLTIIYLYVVLGSSPLSLTRHLLKITSSKKISLLALLEDLPL